MEGTATTGEKNRQKARDTIISKGNKLTALALFLVRSVGTVRLSVALPVAGDALTGVAGELLRVTGSMDASQFVRSIPTVVLIVTQPRARDALPIRAPGLVWLTRPHLCSDVGS